MKKCFTRKLWRIMKLCAVQAALIVTIVGVSLAHDNYGQMLDTRITIKLKDAPLETILKEIELAAKIKFAYSHEQLDLQEKISVNFEDQSLGEVLEELFASRQIKFKVHEKESSISLRKSSDKKQSENLFPDKVPTLITGTVTDGSNNQPLAGVNVIVKGTTQGTTTDSYGKFSLSADQKDILIFSFIGFTPFETQVGDRTIIDIVLQEDVQSLNQVVINAGYWTVKEKEQTGNIARITADEIKSQPVSNPLQAMSGRMAGVLVTQETGVAGGGIQIQIRGKNSISSGNDPLYIIDGIPVVSTSLKSNSFGSALGAGSPFSTINPNDIESIEVLKDGAATAIYGSRGANGVILITTKKGAAGKTKVDVTVSTGFSQVTNMMKLLSSPQYLTMRRESFKNDGITPTTSNAYDLLLWDTTRYTNWQKELIGNTGHVTNVNTSVSGGDKNTQFLISGGYYKEGTVFPGNFGFTRGTGSISVNHRSANDRFQAYMSVNYQYESNQLFNGDLTNQAILLSPNAPQASDQNGNLYWGPPSTFDNPLAYLQQKYDVTTDNFRANSRIGYKLTSDLEFKTNLGYTRVGTESYSSVPVASLDPSYGVTTGSAYFGNGTYTSWIVEPQLEYKKVLKQSAINVLLGTTFLNSQRNTSTVLGTGYVNEQLMDNPQAAGTVSISEASNTQYRYSAVFGRINYTLKDKYIFDLTGRRDGSSRFGPDRRFASFGSVSGAWVFSKEDFATVLTFLSFGKLRASYGTSGNDQIGDYGYLDTYTSTRPYAGAPGLIPSRLVNPSYSWETNAKLEGGIELGFLNDRLFLSLSYYRNRSSNQLVGQPLSGVTGFTSVQSNLLATVENTGLEIELSSTNLKRGDFSWNSSLNFTIPRNKLIEFQSLSASVYANQYVIGESINISKVFRYNGVDPTSGLYTFQDVDGNGTITSPTDNQTIINATPTFFGGLNNSLKYKNWTLSFFFQYVKQISSSYLTAFGTPGFIRNQPEEVMTRWSSTDMTTNVQRFSATTSTAYNAFNLATRSERNYEDASYLRMKNISLSYALPKAWTDKVKMQRAEVFFQGQNLLTITSYKGLDPETRSFINLPPLRTITFGAHITF